MPVEAEEEIDVFRRTMRYVRSELNSVESSLAKKPQEHESREKTLEMLGQLTGEMGHYLDHAFDACRAMSERLSEFNPRQVLQPLWGIFEFKAGQKDITLDIMADPGLPATVPGREKLFRGLFVLVLSYVLHISKSGSAVRCNLRSDAVCEFQCEISEFDAGQSTVADLLETLISCLIRMIAAQARVALRVNEADRILSFEIAQKTESPILAGPEDTQQSQDIPDESMTIESAASEQTQEEVQQQELAAADDEQAGELFEQLQPEIIAAEPEPAPEPEPEPEPEKEIPQEEWKEPEPARLKVIIAEDNALSQKFLRRIVEDEGHEAVCVNNGRELISRLEKDPFDVCLLDCQMGVLDGYKATGIIRANEARLGRRTRIIGMATHLDVDNEDRCLQAGMDAYMSKPIHKGMLIDLLKRFSK